MSQGVKEGVKETTGIKSNNPHLTGGEQEQSLSFWSPNEHPSGFKDPHPLQLYFPKKNATLHFQVIPSGWVVCLEAPLDLRLCLPFRGWTPGTGIGQRCFFSRWRCVELKKTEPSNGWCGCCKLVNHVDLCILMPESDTVCEAMKEFSATFPLG